MDASTDGHEHLCTAVLSKRYLLQLRSQRVGDVSSPPQLSPTKPPPLRGRSLCTESLRTLSHPSDATAGVFATFPPERTWSCDLASIALGAHTFVRRLLW